MHLRDEEFSPDSILPEQLADRPLGGARLQPEKRLQIAVLADAILTFRRWSGVAQPRGRRLFDEVDAWFASDETNGPFTFATICDSLGFDPAYVRSGLRPAAVRQASIRRDGNGSRHRVGVPRLRQVA